MHAGGLLGHEQPLADLAVRRPSATSSRTSRSRGVRPSSSSGARPPGAAEPVAPGRPGRARPSSPPPSRRRRARRASESSSSTARPRRAGVATSSAERAGGLPRRAIAGLGVRLGLAPAGLRRVVRALDRVPRLGRRRPRRRRRRAAGPQRLGLGDGQPRRGARRVGTARPRSSQAYVRASAWASASASARSRARWAASASTASAAAASRAIRAWSCMRTIDEARRAPPAAPRAPGRSGRRAAAPRPAAPRSAPATADRSRAR